MDTSNAEKFKNVYQLTPAIIFLITILICLMIILFLNKGQFTYGLDDAYIHLALAENIAQGHYGINLNEFSAPCSTIIWPFILSVFSLFSWGVYPPLVLNIMVSLGSILIACRLLDTAPNAGNPGLTVFLVCLMFMAGNMVGLVFTGMEHSLQLFFSMVILWGLYLEYSENRLYTWLLIAIITAPLVRFESLALSFPALGYLFSRGYRLKSTAVFMCIITMIACFCLFLKANGHGWLPSSILAKSEVVSGSDASHVTAVFENLKKNLRQPAAWLLLSASFLIMIQVFRGSQPEPPEPETVEIDKSIAWIFTIAAWGHVVLGDFFWLERYEIYIYVPLLVLLFRLYRPRIEHLYYKAGMWKKALVCFPFLVFTFPYMVYTLTVPIHSNNIYAQQYQMHRFITEYYKAPVAVNDLGLVSYQNDLYVLDCWGLGSYKALTKRKQKSHDWMDALTQEYDVKLAMIYNRWFTWQIPPHWILIAEMRIEGPMLVLGQREVSFYATDKRAEKDILKKLESFEKILPRKTTIQYYPQRFFIKKFDFPRWLPKQLKQHYRFLAERLM